MARDDRVQNRMSFEDTLGKRSNDSENNDFKESNIADTVNHESNTEEHNSVENIVDNSPKNDVEYKGELASVLNREETEKKYKGWNIKVSSIKRLRELCKDQPKGAETNLVNLIIENALDNIESKGKL
ncbi:hypothetical protein, partial [Mammaliicoccus sciuri]|uniref:hypothetical protein n=1 Tax=Mammaliicoccus sciuri TaxID=1296 RepID=UPI0027377EBC